MCRQTFFVDRGARANLLKQRPCVVWFTGLPAAGKSTIANVVEQMLHSLGYATYLLDGDNLRLGINKDLGFKAADRIENVRRTAEIAKLLLDSGLIVLVSVISPFAAEREAARSMFETGEFLEIYVNAPLHVCEARDPKGLYRKARKGEVLNFTGVNSPYEPPTRAELEIRTDLSSAEMAAIEVMTLIGNRKSGS